MNYNSLVLVIAALILGVVASCFASDSSFRRQLAMVLITITSLASVWFAHVVVEPPTFYFDRSISLSAFMMCLITIPINCIFRLSASGMWFALTSLIALYLTQMCLVKSYLSVAFVGQEFLSVRQWAENPTRQILFDWSLIVGWTALTIRYRSRKPQLVHVVSMIPIVVLVGLRSTFLVSVATIASDLEAFAYYSFVLYFPALILKFTSPSSPNDRD